MKLLTILLLTGLLSTPIAHLAYAQSSSVNAIGSKAPGWAELSTPQKEVLASLEEDWASLTPEQKSKWAQLANRYDQFSDTEKEILLPRDTPLKFIGYKTDVGDEARVAVFRRMDK